ncbi:MAG TPA: cellulase family glycosylhydrolase [Nitrososphaera sp.]|nr:cellulase family glycosylhydrolase [Nitrososphaera sp.]
MSGRPFLGGADTRALLLTAIATASVALALTLGGALSAKPYDPAEPPEPVCPMGYQFSDGECVLVTPPTTCPEGYHLEGENCAPDVIPSCPEGYVYSEGECLQIEQPKPEPGPGPIVEEPPIDPEPAVIPFSELHGVNYIDPVLSRKEHSPKLPVQAGQVEKFVSIAKESGYNVFRIPLSWESYVGNEENFLGQLVALVEEANSHDIFVWIDFHHFDATSNWPAKVSKGRGFPEFVVSCYHPKGDYERDPEVRAFWDDYYNNKVRDSSNSCKRTLDVWSLQADFMKSMIDEIDQYPNVIGYELLNEPHVWKDDQYEKLGKLHTELAKDIRKSTDRVIIFTRETSHGFESDGGRYPRKIGQEYKILPKDPAKNVMYIPHLYNLNEIEEHVERWKEDQKRWKSMGYDVKIAVGEWSPQPPQLEEGNAVTMENMEGFVKVWKREGWMNTYWAFGGFNFGEGNVLVKESGIPTEAGDFFQESIQKFYDLLH